MDKKVGGIGIIILMAVAVFIALPLFTEAGSSVNTLTATRTRSNDTITMPAAGGTLELVGQNVVSGTVIITNSTDGIVVPANNYTVTQALGVDGQIATTLTADTGYYNSQSVNISYGYEPDGYIGGAVGGAGRGIASLILVFGAVAIAFVTFPDLRGVFS